MRSGFIIVEWMLQFLLCTLIGILTFALFRAWSTSLSRLHTSLDGALQMPMACDILRRDVQNASAVGIKIGSDYCVIQTAQQRIRWQIKKGVLMRVLSNFDRKMQRWKKSVKNIAAERVGNIRFDSLKSSKTHEFTGIKLINESDLPLCVISLRNGKTL